jgi:intracellular septation protein
MSPETPVPVKVNPLLKLALEMGPLVVFFATNAAFGIFTGTAAFMVATVVALGLSYAIMRTIPIMPLVTAVFVLVFGGLTLYLADETFIKLKPTIVDLLFATILFAGLVTRRLFIKLIFESAFQLTDRGWILLTKAWKLFFLFLAALNETVWRNFSTDTWVSFKVFGVMPITLLFSLALFPVIMRHAVEPENVPDSENKSDVDTTKV